MFQMKISSFNIRGLGSKLKKDGILSFFTKNQLDFCCVHETKMEIFSELDGRLYEKRQGSNGAAKVLQTGPADYDKFGSTSQWSLGGAVVVVGSGEKRGRRCALLMSTHSATSQISYFFGIDYSWLSSKGQIFRFA